MLSPSLHRIVIYTKTPQEMAAFYAAFFGYEAITGDSDRIVELRPPAGGLTLLLHPASRGQKEGQALVKLMFDVENVEECCAELKARGLAFGPIHAADGYSFANAKDPSGNSIAISSRALADLGD